MANQNIAGTATFGFNAVSKGVFYPIVGAPASWYYGGVQFPLAATSANSLLQDADPALFYALDFYSFVINKYLGARFATVAAVATYCGSDTNVMTNLVTTSVGYNPLPHLGDTQLALPLLAIYRISGEGSYKTVMKSQEKTTWEFIHVLPPMDASTAEIASSIHHALELLCQNRTEQGMDPSYTPPGGSLGQQAWQIAGIEEIQWVGCKYELFQGADPLPMPVLVGKIIVSERQNAYVGFPPFQGALITESLFDTPTQTTVSGVVNIDTWIPIPPTI